MHCKNCGVELEDNMLNCPLCGAPVNDNSGSKVPGSNFIAEQPLFGQAKMSRPQKKFTWEIVSVILLSGAIASFIVDFFINKGVTWSEYTVAIGLTIFSYVSLFAFWEQRTIVEIIGGFIISSFFLILLDALTKGISWSVQLAIPLLFTANFILIILIVIIRRSKFKGVNLIAFSFIAAAMLCICTDAVLSYFKNHFFRLRWSIIVSACVIPVSVVLFFVHYRLKKGRNLKRAFHI